VKDEYKNLVRIIAPLVGQTAVAILSKLNDSKGHKTVVPVVRELHRIASLVSNGLRGGAAAKEALGAAAVVERLETVQVTHNATKGALAALRRAFTGEVPQSTPTGQPSKRKLKQRARMEEFLARVKAAGTPPPPKKQAKSKPEEQQPPELDEQQQLTEKSQKAKKIRKKVNKKRATELKQ
jgi:hypothetical protein